MSSYTEEFLVDKLSKLVNTQESIQSIHYTALSASLVGEYLFSFTSGSTFRVGQISQEEVQAKCGDMGQRAL